MKKSILILMLISFESLVLQAEKPLRPYVGTSDFKDLTGKDKQGNRILVSSQMAH